MHIHDYVTILSIDSFFCLTVKKGMSIILVKNYGYIPTGIMKNWTETGSFIRDPVVISTTSGTGVVNTSTTAGTITYSSFTWVPWNDRG